MIDEVKKEINNFYSKYYYYPKIKDLIDWERLLNRSDQLAKDILKQEGKENIWEIVENWWTQIFKLLYLY